MIEPPVPKLSWVKILPVSELVFLGRNQQNCRTRYFKRKLKLCQGQTNGSDKFFRAPRLRSHLTFPQLDKEVNVLLPLSEPSKPAQILITTLIWAS